MFRGGFEAADRMFNLRCGQRFQLRSRFSEHPFGQGRTRGDRGGAASDLIANFHDAVILKPRR